MPLSGKVEGNTGAMGTKETIGQGIRYLLVGGGSAAIDVGLFQALYSFGVEAALANVVSLSISTVFNFLMNRNVTFKSAANPVRSVVAYLLLLAFNMAFSSFAITALIGFGWHSLLAKLVALACTTSWNFVLYRKVVFPTS